MVNNKELIFEFRFTRAYIEDKSFLIYKKIREKYISLVPPLEIITYNNRKRSKPFFVIYKDKKLEVFMDFQGHVRQADKSSLYKWYEENKPEEGDSLLWYKTDKAYEFLIELKRKQGYFPSAIKMPESEKILTKPPQEIKYNEKMEDELNKIIKLYELKGKKIITSDEYQELKDKLLSEMEITLNNIEKLYEIFNKGLINEKDFDRKKKELLSSFDPQKV